MCFSNLTLQEHIMFYTMLKRGSYSEALSSSTELAGNADVLVLDEPITGLLIETRRELWDLLLSLRGKHTILITTHFMEEADTLADRVAALYAGELRCFGTTMFLKKAIGYAVT